PERLGVSGAVALELEDDLRRGLVVRGFEDLDDVVTPEGDIDTDERPARLGDRPLAFLDAVAPGGQPGDALRRPAHQRHVVRHGTANDDGAPPAASELRPKNRCPTPVFVKVSVAPEVRLQRDNSDVRLNAFLARAGVASRRRADELIKAGRVTVNGEPGQLNTFVEK